MNDAAASVQPLAFGEVMPGGAVGRVLESRDPRFVVGGIVQGMLGWQDYAVVSASELRPIDESANAIQTSLGVLGMPGLTAYFGLLDVCHSRAQGDGGGFRGGGGGGVARGQLARIMGCRVVGIAGSDAKVAFLVDGLGFHEAFNYKTVADFTGALTRLCPKGVDVYFDTVGGAITDAVLRLINVKGRISLCGQISQYNLETEAQGPRFFGLLATMRAKAQGFLVSDYAARFSEGRRAMGTWLKQGKLQYREDIAQGLERAPAAFMGMLRGESLRKQLVQVSGWTA
jgi:NADPH-dependent curcumin reductase CurA